VLTLTAGLALVVPVLSELATQSRGRDAIGEQERQVRRNCSVTRVGVLFGHTAVTESAWHRRSLPTRYR